MVYLKSVENVITLGKLIALLFLFCLPLLFILFLKTKRNDLARPVMGTFFLVALSSCAEFYIFMVIKVAFLIPPPHTFVTHDATNQAKCNKSSNEQTETN